MRSLVAAVLVCLGFTSGSFAQTTPACTGLCQQQVSCPAGGTTSVSGVVYAPNGVDPLPNVQVYVPNAAVAAFTPGVSCPVIGQPPSGSPLVGASTAVDGSFTIPNMPVGTNIPLVIVSGRWRRQLVIPSVASCTNTVLPQGFAAFPQNQSQGDIPKIAIATGEADPVECVLRKVGISDSEFTDPSGTGRINFYLGTGNHGSEIDASTPSASVLMGDTTNATLLGYDVLMLPCEGSAYPNAKNATEYSNLVAFANAGGRVYASHFSYQWMYENTPFNTVANWAPNSAPTPNDGPATVNTGFSGGQTLSTWLEDVGASTTAAGQPAQIALQSVKHDLNGVIAPTESWITLNSSGQTMQFVFDTPVATSGNTVSNQCGRVLFNEYHVETAATGGGTFPANCGSGTTMTPQEKLLEYSLFELTNDGGSATLTPTSQDFGSVAIGFTSPVQTFTWTNNSTFPASVTLLTASGDFSVVSNTCTNVQAYASCAINVTFSPTALGARTGTLTVGSSGNTLTSVLTGTGVPALTVSTANLNFGNVDVGASVTQTISVTNNASGTLPVPALILTGPYTAASTCGASLAVGSSCGIAITFHPITTGPQPGTFNTSTGNAGSGSVLTGAGVDFSLADTPASGTVIAGYNAGTVLTTTPIAGFGATVTLTCTTNAPASACNLSPATFAPTAAVTTNVTITTTSQYTVVGYGGVFGAGWLSLLGAGAAWMLCLRRRSAGSLARYGMAVLLALTLGAGMMGLSGCSGKLPAQNAVYTPATGTAGTAGASGPYTYTIRATDGFLVHTATYSLTVTAK